MSVERKSLFIELFVQSHLVLSSIAEDKLKHRCFAILQFDSNVESTEIQKVSDYSHHLNYIKNMIVRAIDKFEKSSEALGDTLFKEVITNVENANSGEELFLILEEMLR